MPKMAACGINCVDLITEAIKKVGAHSSCNRKKSINTNTINTKINTKKVSEKHH